MSWNRTMAACLVMALSAGARAQPADAGSHQARVIQRGDRAMGFSHERAAHHFGLTKAGGFIAADAKDPHDLATRDAIRAHFGHIARAFSEGDFDLPMFIHGRTPPGVETMKRLRDRIEYRSTETQAGARVEIRSDDPVARRAIHQFLRFQIRDHHTGDSLETRDE